MARSKKANLPTGWTMTKVGLILRTSSGGTPSTHRKEYWTEGTIPWLNSGGLTDGDVNEPTTFITDQALANSSAKLFPVNTTLVALTGSTVGKVGLLTFECSTNQSVVGIYPSQYVHHKFIFYYFLSKKSYFISKAIGSAQPHINKSIIDNADIAIPPLAHQRKIVDMLDKIHQKIESVNLRAGEIDKLENDAVNSFLFRKGKAYPSVKLSQFCTLRKKRIGSNWKGKRLIGVSKDSGIVDLRVSVKQSFENYKIVEPGDFIYNPMRIDIGSIAIYEESTIALTSPDYIVFSVDDSISPLLLLKFLKSSTGLAQINQHTQGSVRSRLYFNNLIDIEFPFAEKDQKKAQKVLRGFEATKSKTLDILSTVRSASEKELHDAIHGKSKSLGVYSEDASTLIQKMKTEKKVKIKAKPKAKPKQIETVNFDLKSFVKQTFGKSRFKFSDLHVKSGVEYETLKALVYDGMSTDLKLEFDSSKELMFLKLK